ncbi:hypothetical protein [Streptomyces sp. NPDC060022]|uniref:hypothetical protein n=1 Tax=Streptomyces sp. NPDC060022 TaxID=3347039 RepID=UPI0036C96CC3
MAELRPKVNSLNLRQVVRRGPHEVGSIRPDEARQGAYRPGQGGADDYWFYKKDNDLLITKGDGSSFRCSR